MRTLLLISGHVAASEILAAAHRLDPALRAIHLADVEALRTEAARAGPTDLLLAFATGLIVPADILAVYGDRAINIHPASPEFPGRDPHHFAIYRKTKTFGTTAHIMAAKVDAGDILDVELFPVQPGETPQGLMQQAEATGLRLIERLLPELLAGRIRPKARLTWGPLKSTRAMFHQLCKVTPDISAEEFHDRQAAVHVEGRNNLTLDLHGWRFRIEGPAPSSNAGTASLHGASTQLLLGSEARAEIGDARAALSQRVAQALDEGARHVWVRLGEHQQAWAEHLRNLGFAANGASSAFRLEADGLEDERVYSLWSEPDWAEWGDFTLESYGKILTAAAERYRFASFEQPGEGCHVIWRHDLDASLSRALPVAELEAERGVPATYFLWLGCPYYNPFEADLRALLRRLCDLGHSVGLHFEAAAYDRVDWTRADLERAMAEERDAVARIVGRPVTSVSFHNPDQGGMLRFDQEVLAGMVNAYARSFREGYGYCSDSNGYWRHRPILDTIENGDFERLVVLTHPEWWTPRPMPPRLRIATALEDQRERTLAVYDNYLKTGGRINRKR